MREIRVNEIPEPLFAVIDYYAKNKLATIVKDGRAVGSIASICYLPRYNPDNTGQLRFIVFEEIGEQRVNEDQLERYLISW